MLTIKTNLNFSPEQLHEIEQAVKTRPLFFNDLTCKHWFFDFKIFGRFWVTSNEITDDLKNYKITITE